jgi:hypothetical protein
LVCAARDASGPESITKLASLAAPSVPKPIRLEALSALTALEVDAVRSCREIAAIASDDPDHNISSTGNYLLLRIDGNYDP